MTGCGRGAAGGPVRHIPVLLDEVVEALSPRDGGVYIDGTFGAGGYSRAILKAADCRVFAIERDDQALEAGGGMEDEFGGRFTLVKGRFSQMAQLLRSYDLDRVDGVVLDIGVSSMQLDDAGRGFSFMSDGPLDMRMERQGPSAADIVNGVAERDLARIIAVLGEERKARRVARAIVKARADAPIRRTSELAAIVEKAVAGGKPLRIHPATRTFQGLRIFVNQELEELARGLGVAETLLKQGGRLVVVTFHSLEDRIVKRFFNQRSRRAPQPSRHAPIMAGNEKALSFALVHKGALTASEAELARNPRARSARLRAGARLAGEAFDLDMAALGVPELNLAGGDVLCS